MARSFSPASHLSPNWVHPMPMMATRSFMLSMTISSLSHRPAFPVVVLEARPLVDPAESELHGHAHPHFFGLAVSHHAVDPGLVHLRFDHALDQHRVVAPPGQVVQGESK